MWSCIQQNESAAVMLLYIVDFLQKKKEIKQHYN